MSLCKIPVMVSESPNWPLGGVALAKRGGLVVALLKPGLSKPERQECIDWVHAEIEAARDQLRDSQRPPTAEVATP